MGSTRRAVISGVATMLLVAGCGRHPALTPVRESGTPRMALAAVAPGRAAERAPPDPPGAFTLVGLVPGQMRTDRLSLVALGDRVVFLERLPIAAAKGSGPFALTTEMARGLPRDDQAFAVHGLAGGAGDAWAIGGHVAARATPEEGRAYHWDGRAWTPAAGFVHGSNMAHVTAVLPWKTKGAVVVENGYGTSKEESEAFATETRVVWLGPAPKPATRKLPFYTEAVAAEGGHLWILGMTHDEKAAIVHVKPSGEHETHTLPAPPGCDVVVGTNSALLALPSGRAVVVLATGGPECTADEGPLLFEHGASGWSAGPPLASRTALLAVDARGTRWTAERGSLVAREDGGRVRRERLPSIRIVDGAAQLDVDRVAFDEQGAPVLVNDVQPPGCYDTAMLIREQEGGTADRWLVRDCHFPEAPYVTAVFRENAKQTPAVAPEVFQP